MDDAADHPPIIDARLASRIGRQVRRYPRELPIRQPEMIAIHRHPSPEPLNHEMIRAGSGLMGPNPKSYHITTKEYFGEGWSQKWMNDSRILSQLQKHYDDGYKI